MEKDVLVCGHDDGEVNTNHCAACSVEYDKAKEWVQCPGLCEQWFHEQCFYNQILFFLTNYFRRFFSQR